MVLRRAASSPASAAGASRACRRRSSRSRTRATCWSAVQLPDGASLERTDAALDRGQRDRHGDAGRRPGRGASAGISVLDNNAIAGQRRRRLRDPQGLERARQGRRTCARSSSSMISASCRTLQDGRVLVAAAAADPGHRQCRRLHDAGRAARRQLRLRQAAERRRRRWSSNASTQSALPARDDARSAPARRSTASMSTASKARDAATCRSATCSRRSQTYLGSTYVNQFNKFGRTFQVYVQADAQYRAAARGHRASCTVRNSRGQDGAARRAGRRSSRRVGPAADQPLQSLSVRDDRRLAGAGLQLGRGAWR